MNILDRKELRDRLEREICEGQLCSHCFLNKEDTPCLLALLHDSVEEELVNYEIGIGEYVVNNNVVYRVISNSMVSTETINLIDTRTGMGLGIIDIEHITLGALNLAYGMEFTIPTHGGEQEN